MFAVSSKRVLPGFTLSLGTSLLFVCLILLLPLSALVMQLAQMSWAQYWDVITNPQVVAAYKVTLLSAFVASIFNGVFGLLMAWILTRYRFPGRTLLDALMDLDVYKRQTPACSNTRPSRSTRLRPPPPPSRCQASSINGAPSTALSC